jgi:hypothetical protein
VVVFVLFGADATGFVRLPRTGAVAATNSSRRAVFNVFAAKSRDAGRPPVAVGPTPGSLFWMVFPAAGVVAPPWEFWPLELRDCPLPAKPAEPEEPAEPAEPVKPDAGTVAGGIGATMVDLTP